MKANPEWNLSAPAYSSTGFKQFYFCEASAFILLQRQPAVVLAASTAARGVYRYIKRDFFGRAVARHVAFR
jgi:hypothetical protein